MKRCFLRCDAIRLSRQVLAVMALAAAFHGPGFASSTVEAGDWLLVGQGKLRWFGLEVYHASLHAPSAAAAHAWDAEPVALKIVYQRSITAAQLLEATQTEWERLGQVESAAAARWLADLSGIWPDVAPGDSITTVVTPSRVTEFFHNGQFRGAVTDPAFGSALLAIWLDPNARHDRLREALLGLGMQR